MPISPDHASDLADKMPSQGTAPQGAQTVIDPVCGMTVTLKADTPTESFGGKPFHFCSEKCQTKFKGDP